MPFKPGQSGNPSGKNGQKPVSDALKGLLSRKPGKTMNKSVCETNAQLIAFNLLVRALGGDKDSIREVIDRTEGRPMQALQHSGPEGGAIEHRMTDLSKLTNDQLSQLEHIAGVVGPAGDPG